MIEILWPRSRRIAVALLIAVVPGSAACNRETGSLAGEPAFSSADSIATESARPPEPLSAFPSMAAFEGAFDRGSAPQAPDLIGEWVLIQIVFRKSPSDEIQFDSTGFRRDDIAGRPLEWKLVISHDSTGALRFTSQYPWEPHETSGLMHISETAGMWFDADFGGDSLVRYRCRMRHTNRLICLAGEPDAFDGREFLKQVGG